ncbi:STAS domain-containing protein [Kitasatospora sp. NPDC085879]|uniref:STAS domain-containing protein n=1 Tax=Kitasatospora sp. NPDC085879 TaxID=3154769 RepID=UPI0015C8F527|nr:STAS domain-containing protein [Streptomyces sp. TLI_235]
MRGELDLDNAEDLYRTLTDALQTSTGGLDLDLAGVTFCGSSGLNIMLRLRNHAAKTGRTVKVTAASRQVERLLAVTETGPLFGLPPGEPS